MKNLVLNFFAMVSTMLILWVFVSVLQIGLAPVTAGRTFPKYNAIVVMMDIHNAIQGEAVTSPAFPFYKLAFTNFCDI